MGARIRVVPSIATRCDTGLTVHAAGEPVMPPVAVNNVHVSFFPMEPLPVNVALAGRDSAPPTLTTLPTVFEDQLIVVPSANVQFVLMVTVLSATVIAPLLVTTSDASTSAVVFENRIEPPVPIVGLPP